MTPSFLPDHNVLPSVSLEILAADLRVAQVAVKIAGRGPLAADPAVLGKLRGALGTDLHSTASLTVRSDQDCTWEPPCSYQVLWRNNGEVRPGYPLPSPLVLETNAIGRDLWVTARLFGRGGDYLGEVSDALIRGIRGGLSGVADPPLEVADRHWAETVGIPIVRQKRLAILKFITPVLSRNSATGDHAAPRALLRSLVHRVDGIARWNGMRLASDEAKRLLGLVVAVEGVWKDAEPDDWTRHSKPQDKSFDMQGLMGQLCLGGDLAPLSALIHWAS